MKLDRKALCLGIALVAAVPLVMLRQSSIASTGTIRAKPTRDLRDHFVSCICEHLYKGRAAGLDMLCDQVLAGDRNGAYVATWIDYVTSKRGGCADVRAARGRLYAALGDREATRREFDAARAAVRTAGERQRVEGIIERYRVWTDAADGPSARSSSPR